MLNFRIGFIVVGGRNTDSIMEVKTKMSAIANSTRIYYVQKHFPVS
jgi:hypothetical protein